MSFDSKGSIHLIGKNIGACCSKSDAVKIFDMTDSVRIYDRISDEFDYLSPKGSAAVTYNEKFKTCVLDFCLNSFHNETVRIWSSSLRSPSPPVCSTDSEIDSEKDSKSLTSFTKKCCQKCR